MVSNSVGKLIRKLHAKKYRVQYGMFMAEGPKVVKDLINAGLKAQHLITTNLDDWYGHKPVEVTQEELKIFSTLETPNQVLGIFSIPKIDSRLSDIILVLDGIKDPGNLGTIIRTCDWFGITKVYCTNGTVDLYNSKTVQSTMGSIAKVSVEYKMDEEIMEDIPNSYDWVVADMKGESLSDFKRSQKLVLIMGGESHGPSGFWKDKAKALTIPKLGDSAIDSLNVAVATSVILGKFQLG